MDMMNNIINPMGRIAGIYGNQQQPDSSMGAPQIPNNSPPPEVQQALDPNAMPPDMSTIRGITLDRTLSSMQPAQRHAMYDKLIDMLNNAPQRQEPTFMNRLAGGLVGFGGGSPAQIDEAKYGDYNRKRRDYETNLENTYKGAALEDKMNAGDIRDWYNQKRIENLEDRENRLGGLGWYRAGQRDTELEQKAQRLTSDIAIANRKAALQEKLANGYTIWVNKQDGKVYLNHKDGRPLEETSLDGLSEEELQRLKTNGHLNEIDARGNIQKAIADANNKAAAERNEAAIAGRKEVAETRGKTGGTANENSKEIAKQRARTRRAQEFVDANPDAASFIVFGPSGAITFKPPSRFQLEATRKLREAARVYIDQDYQGAGSSSSGTITPGAGTVTPPAQRGNATQSGGGAGILPAPTADAKLMNDAIAAIDKENAKRAAEGNKLPQLKKDSAAIKQVMENMKKQGGNK